MPSVVRGVFSVSGVSRDVRSRRIFREPFPLGRSVGFGLVLCVEAYMYLPVKPLCFLCAFTLFRAGPVGIQATPPPSVSCEKGEAG